MQDEQLQFFANLIEKELGIVYSKENTFQLKSRLEEIMTYFSLKSLDQLYEIAKKNVPPDMLQLLLDTATNNETLFFRDPKVFSTFKDIILPELKEKIGSSRKIRIWSAASSTGQEPYSLSMIVNDSKSQPVTNVEIVASDISERVLKRAQEGVYSQLEVQRGLPPQLLVKHFIPSGGNWILKPEIKTNVQFKKVNLLEPFTSMGSFDVIFCRNVLIYQNVERKKNIIERMHNLLTPEGILFLGAGESLLGLSDAFEQSQPSGATYYRKKVSLKAA